MNDIERELRRTRFQIRRKTKSAAPDPAAVDPDEQARRAERRREKMRKAGVEVDVCIGCGCTDVSLFELDHIAGRKHDPTVWPLCEKCHQEKTDMLYDEPPPTEDPRNPLEVIGRWLLGVAQYFELLSPVFRKCGNFLIELAAQGYGSEFKFPT